MARTTTPVFGPQRYRLYCVRKITQLGATGFLPWRRRPRQYFVQRVAHDCIAFACCALESLAVGDDERAAAVVDQSCLLQRPRHQGDAGALDAEHIRQELMGETE